MKTKKARIKYCEDFDGQEGYAVEIFTNGEWGLDSFYPLVKRDEHEENNFVHYSLINKIHELSDYNYKISF